MRYRIPVLLFVLYGSAFATAGPNLDRGEFYFEYPSSEPLMTVRCRPMQWLDERFYLSEGDPSMFLFAFGNPAGKNPDDPHLMVALPRDVHVTAMHVNLELERSTDWEAGRRLHDFKLPRTARIYASEDGAAASRGLSLLVRADIPAGTGVPDMVYWYRDGDRAGPRSALKLTVLPSIRARMPRDFKVGPMLRKPTFYLRGPGADTYGEFLKRCGIGWTVAAANAPTTLACMKAGLDVASGAGLANGYMLGWRTHPEDVAFYLATGERMKRAVCPTAIYTRHPYIQEHLYENIVRKLIARDRTANHLTTNWEPYMFLGKGCFCDRCREEFIRWSKLPADEVRNEWPLDVVKKHKETWEKFFAWQHGRILIALEKMCREAGKEVGVESHFAPQIACNQVDPEQRDHYYERMTDIEQYASQVPWIQLWGGYMTWDIVKPRRRPVAGRLNLHKFAGLARSWKAKHPVEGGRRIVSWGHGTYLGASTCTFPEAVRFDIECLFLNGIDRTAAYVFPMGYDNRYWAAMAGAADAAAEFEPFVRDGKRVRTHEVEAATPVPQVEDGPVLRSFEFERDGSRLIAVGNFWREGEVFFRLRLSGLSAKERFTLREPRESRTFGSSTGEAFWTGEQLARGALLHVGRLRWAFLEIKPFQVASRDDALLTQTQVNEIMKERMPAIRKNYAAAMETIAEMEKARTGEAGDYSRLRALALGALKCAIRDVNGDGKPEVVYTRPGEELVVEPSKGARVLHWKLDGFDVAFELGAHTLAVDATWAPAAFVTGEVKVLEHKVTPEGIALVTERVIPKAARGILPGIKVTRTLLAPKTLGAFRVTTQLTNTGKELKEFAYRHTATPRFLTRTKGGEGWVRLWGKDGPIQFKRNFLKNAYHMAGRPRTERLDIYAMDVSKEVTEPRVRFGCGWSPVQVEAEVERGKLYKFVFWDSGGQAASTAEFVCRNLKLKPGQSWSVTVDWRRVK